LQQEQDSPLKMEPWMTEEDTWYSCQKHTGYIGTKNKGSEMYNRREIWECMNYVPIEMEGLIVSDSWMTDDHVWCNEYSVTVFVPLER
jgi:hypothetical protein